VLFLYQFDPSIFFRKNDRSICLFERLSFFWYFQATAEANNLAAKSVSKEFYIRAMEQVKNKIYFRIKFSYFFLF
jgi:hypothetical protein